VHADKQKKEPYVSLQRAGANLRGLMRVLLFKRFESSVYAFRETVKRLLKIHQAFIASLDDGVVPAGEDAQAILYESDASPSVISLRLSATCRSVTMWLILI
jgi:hypothetical protein